MKEGGTKPDLDGAGLGGSPAARTRTQVCCCCCSNCCVWLYYCREWFVFSWTAGGDIHHHHCSVYHHHHRGEGRGIFQYKNSFKLSADWLCLRSNTHHTWLQINIRAGPSRSNDKANRLEMKYDTYKTHTHTSSRRNHIIRGRKNKIEATSFLDTHSETAAACCC